MSNEAIERDALRDDHVGPVIDRRSRGAAPEIETQDPGHGVRMYA